MYTYVAEITKVIDGDTIDVNFDLGFGVWLKNQRVRLKGIDTPEKRTKNPIEKKAGQLVTDYVTKSLPVGSFVKMTTHKDEDDKYGRLLVEVFLENGDILNQVLIEKKLAVAYEGQNKQEVKALHESNWSFLKSQGLI